jgi:hypothetical protein
LIPRQKVSILARPQILTRTGVMNGEILGARAVYADLQRSVRLAFAALYTRTGRRGYERLKRLRELFKWKKETDEDLIFGSSTICLV